MERRILAVGDVTAGGLQFLRRRLPKLLRQREIDFCVVNGENASLVGITPEQAEAIFSAGANVITLGNHAFNRREIVPLHRPHAGAAASGQSAASAARSGLGRV